MDEVEGVQADPEDHDPDLRQDEDPASDEASEVGGDAIGEGELALHFAVEVSDRGVVVLVLDEVPRDVFDFSADRHGSFLWGCCVECRGLVRMHSFAQRTPIWLRKVSLGLQADRAPHQEHWNAPPPIFVWRAVRGLVRRRRFADCLNQEARTFQCSEIGLQRVCPARETHVQSVTRWPRAARSRLTLPSPQPTSRVRFTGGGTSSKNAGEYFQYASNSGRRAHAAQLPDSFSQCSRDTRSLIAQR